MNRLRNEEVHGRKWVKENPVGWRIGQGTHKDWNTIAKLSQLFKFGIASRLDATVPARENVQWQPQSLWQMFASTSPNDLYRAYTGKSFFIPGWTPWLNLSLADYEEYSVSWSQQDSPAQIRVPEPCQVSSLNLIAAILASIPCDAIIMVCKYITYSCI